MNKRETLDLQNLKHNKKNKLLTNLVCSRLETLPMINETIHFVGFKALSQ